MEPGEAEGGGWRRWRWRLRGAAMWPTFAACAVLDVALLRELPLSRDGTSMVDAFVVAGALNLAVVAVLGPLAGVAVRRRRPDLPRVVAANYAGTTLLVALTSALAVGGLLEHSTVLAAQQAFSAQSDALRTYVEDQAPAYRAYIRRADSVRLQANLFRTCVPSARSDEALCLYIDTSESPPGVTLDPNRAPNWRFFNRRPDDYR